MFEFIGLAIVAGSLLFGYTTARQFVRDRLRYVDAIRGMKAPILAAVGASVIALPVFAFLPLPFFGVGTAALFGLSVGVGVRAGAKDIRGNSGYIEGP